jgi:hypothetical protein
VRRLTAVVLLCVALSGCSSSGSPAADLQTKLNAVITAGNSKDAAALRTAVDAFLQEVAAQSQNGDITATKADALRTVADRVLVEAGQLEPSASPLPSSAPPPPPSTAPAVTPTATPTPTPTPTPPPSPIVVPTIQVSTAPSPTP